MNNNNKIKSEVKWTEEEVQRRMKNGRELTKEEFFAQVKADKEKSKHQNNS